MGYALDYLIEKMYIILEFFKTQKIFNRLKKTSKEFMINKKE